MSYHSGQNRRAPTIRFQWDLPRIDPAWVTLIGSMMEVRAAAGQEGVDKFIDEWRRRGFIECSDEDAARLKKHGALERSTAK